MTWLAIRTGVRRWIERIAQAGLACAMPAVALAVVLPALKEPSGLGLVLALTAGLTFVCSCAGEELAKRLLDHNRALLDVTPLHPSRLLRHNLRGIVLQGIALGVVGPVALASVLLKEGPTYAGWGGSGTLFAKWLVVAHFELTALAILLLPLYLRLTGRRWIGMEKFFALRAV